MSADIFEDKGTAVATAPIPPDAEPESAALIAAPAAPGPEPEAAPVPDKPVEAKVPIAPDTVMRATLEALLGKKRRQDEFAVELPQDSGDSVPVSFLAVAISGPEYDKLVEKFPPTREQAARGNAYDPDAFEPALMAEVVKEPALSKAEWTQVRKSKEWSGGEWASLFVRIQSLCLAGLNVPFS